MKHVPRKRFGQNFLVSPGVIAKIIAAIAPQFDDVLVEIGPGLGALTGPLLDRLAHLHAVEIDRDLIAGLRQRNAPERLTIHEGDALQFDFAVLAGASQDKPILRVVGNLPYNISTPLLFHIANHAGLFSDLHFMLQREVVERMVAAPSTPEYGRLSVMLQYRFRMRKLFGVPSNSFRPAPKVESAVVCLSPRARAENVARDEALLSETVRRAFCHRRKTLRNALAGWAGEPELRAAGIDPGLRAENLSVAQFVALANHIEGRRDGQ